MDASVELRPDLKRARSVSRRLRQILDADGSAIGTPDEALRLCEAGWAAVDDSYCRSVIRAIGVCAQCKVTDEPDSVWPRPLVQSLLAALDARLAELEQGARSGHSPDRRRTQRRNYLLRPATGAVRWRPHRAAAQRDE